MDIKSFAEISFLEPIAWIHRFWVGDNMVILGRFLAGGWAWSRGFGFDRRAFVGAWLGGVWVGGRAFVGAGFGGGGSFCWGGLRGGSWSRLCAGEVCCGGFAAAGGWCGLHLWRWGHLPRGIVSAGFAAAEV